MEIFSLSQLLYYIGFVVWIFPAIRQFRGRFFIFFLILAVADPLTIILLLLFNISVGPLQPLILSSFLVLSVLTITTIKKNKVLLSLLFLLTFLISIWSGNYKVVYGIIALMHVFIFYQILIIFIRKNVDEKAINIFYIVFLLYELTNIFKVSNIVFGITNANEYATITTIFQVAIGLYFSIFREDSTRNLIKL